MERKQIPVGELEFGMYVAELDRPWTDTPFMYQGFELRTDVQLNALKKFCKHVFIDPERTQLPELPPLAAPMPAFQVRGTASYPEKVKVEVEFKRAQPVFEQTVKAVPELLRPVTRPGGVLDTKEI